MFCWSYFLSVHSLSVFSAVCRCLSFHFLYPLLKFLQSVFDIKSFFFSYADSLLLDHIERQLLVHYFTWKYQYHFSLLFILTGTHSQEYYLNFIEEFELVVLNNSRDVGTLGDILNAFAL